MFETVHLGALLYYKSLIGNPVLKVESIGQYGCMATGNGQDGLTYGFAAIGSNQNNDICRTFSLLMLGEPGEPCAANHAKQRV